MPGLASGCNHVALVTQDLERLITFYEQVFDAETVIDMREGPVHHALVDLGGGFCLHPFEFADGNPHGTASNSGFDRGHLDHLAINVDDHETFELLRSRLVEAGATDGELVDFGVVRTVWFTDPDGMGSEIAVWSGDEPRPLESVLREPFTAVSS